MTLKNSLILSIDQGTTSSRALTFYPDGTIHHLAQKELTLITPRNGWVEQEPESIWRDTLGCIKNCLVKARNDGLDIAAIGITNQRETTIVWDKRTGKPLYNAIVWQDRRTADYMQSLSAHGQAITDKTGLLLDPYFSASKIRWILDHVKPENTDNLLFGTVDTYLLWHLTGGRVHATDMSNAGRTLLYNIHEQCWDDELLRLFDIPRHILPTVYENVHDFGVTDEDVVGAALSIGGMAGDQHAALIGQGCFEPGQIKSTYGTGCFMVMNTGKESKPSHNKLLSTIGYASDNKTTFALEGSIFTAGSLIQWLRDESGLIDDAAKTEPLAKSVSDNGGVYIVPALTGLGAPHWKADATGIITGLRRSSTKAHIARAALEAQAYQTYDLIYAMEADSGIPIRSIRADGGLVQNGFAMQFMADILNIPVHIPKNTEATAWGAAVLAGVSAGIFKGIEDSAPLSVVNKTYTPAMDNDTRQALLDGWKKALAQVIT